MRTLARPVPFPPLPMIEQEQSAIPPDQQDPPRDTTDQETPPRPAVIPQNQQDYWRWIQLQVLREREGKSALRE